MKILIINSDSPNNRGDRAILAGNIKLIKDTWPTAKVWALSEYAERDQEWYGIDFLPMSTYSLNPFDLLKLVRFSKKCDYIFWGGGELLKDYTNKIGILYWVFKITPVWLVNKNIYGMFQGIGPTKAHSSKKLIRFLVNRTKTFLVRDKGSKDKLESWGAKVPVISSYDPAVICQNQNIDEETTILLKSSFDIDTNFLRNSMGIGVRKWFHYKKSGLIPFKFRFWEKRKRENNPKIEAYIQNFASLCDWTIETHNLNLVFFPMHMLHSENDIAFSKEIVARMKHANRTRIIDKDILSPQAYLNVIGKCRLFMGVRLHSSILAAAANVPALVFYYVDKGRLFFEQLKMQRFSQPIEDLLEKDNLESIKSEINQLISEGSVVKKELSSNLIRMKKHIYTDFQCVVLEKKE